MYIPAKLSEQIADIVPVFKLSNYYSTQGHSSNGDGRPPPLNLNPWLGGLKGIRKAI